MTRLSRLPLTRAVPLSKAVSPPFSCPWPLTPTGNSPHRPVSLTRVDEVGLRVQQDVQRLHVVVEILEHSRAFAQDAVSGEERPLLLQQQGHVVVSVARREQHSGKKKYSTQLLTITRFPPW